MAKTCILCRYFYRGHNGDPSLCVNKRSNRFPNKVSRDGSNHVCELFRPPKHSHPKSILSQYGENLRFIESLRNTRVNEEIWILATGPSLDDIPDDFLTFKTSIAVKEAGIAFPDCTYNMWALADTSLRRTYLPKNMIPKIDGRVPFEKFIFSIRESYANDWLKERRTDPTYIKYTRGYQQEGEFSTHDVDATLAKMQEMCDNIIARESTMYYGLGTIVHLAIVTAVVMGAKKVSLVGCDHGESKTKSHAMARGLEWCTDFEKSQVVPWGDTYSLMKIGTSFLANYFKKHGIEIMQYNPKKGYKVIQSAA